MKRKIFIHGLQAVSINSAYYADKKLGYKSEVRDWLAQIAYQLNQGENKQAISDLKAHFDNDKHVFHVLLTFHTPKFFTKDGRLSSQSQDLSNIEKVFLDSLFLDAHKNNLCIDDKYITRMVSEKVPAEDWKITATIHIKQLPKR